MITKAAFAFIAVIGLAVVLLPLVKWRVGEDVSWWMIPLGLLIVIIGSIGLIGGDGE